jgi:hypothetical protein
MRKAAFDRGQASFTAKRFADATLAAYASL